ncbi:MAG TPA: hypothetical protein VMC03_19435 [Streptosporangiaceae bacterium]|nr:hypothetical protein [Streptosporangiaceae bacterium]
MFVTSNVTCPAAILAGRGVQPCGVRSIVTVLARAEPDEPAASWELPQPAAASASSAADAAIAVRRFGHLARLPCVSKVQELLI